MKIVDWKLYQPDERFHVLIELISDTGLSGWGAAYSEKEQVTGALQWLRRFVMGEDPVEVERITEKLHAVSFWVGRGGAMTHAISGINLALWDLAGKALGQPVSKLLGGAYRCTVPAYASVVFNPVETLPGRIEEMLARGFRAVKLGWHPFASGSLSEDKALIATARKAVGDNTTLMIDAGGSRPFCTFRLKDALERARMLDSFGVYWFEEPLAPDDLEGYARLTDASPVRIAHGEVLTRRQSFYPYFERRAMDIVQPDVSKVGGLSEARRIAWAAAEKGIDLVPHGFNTAIGVATDIHLVASLSSNSWVEFNTGNALVEELISQPFRLDESGCLPVPETPGLGIDVDRERLERFAVEGFASETWTWDERKDYEA